MSPVTFELSELLDPDGKVKPLIRLLQRGRPARPFAVSGEEPEFARLFGPVAPVPDAAIADPAERRAAVERAGMLLFSKIMENPDIREQLAPRLAPADQQSSPLLVALSATSAERFPFEAMFVSKADFPLLSDGARFLSLSERFAIGRLVDGNAVSLATSSLQPPLRVTALLSALGVPADGQWTALQEAVRARGAVPIRLQVFVSDRRLYDEIAASPEIAGVAGASVELMPTDLEDLRERVVGFAPHVLHFFCHGSAEGSGRLEIATANDVESGADMSSLVLELEQLRRFAPDRVVGDPAWLVLLNCCEVGGMGDGPAENLSSFSLRLMEQSEFGAVIGMSEPVLDSHAALFSRGLYRSLFVEVQRRLDGSSAESLCWPAIAAAGRREVANRPGTALSAAAAEHWEWTLPVVFVSAREWQLSPIAARPEPVPEGEPGGPAVPGETAEPAGPPPVVEEPAAGPSRSEQLEIGLLRSMLARLTPDSPPALRADVLARLAELGAPVADVEPGG